MVAVRELVELDEETIAELAAAKLTYVTDESPGIRRRRSGRGFSYVDAQGRTIQDEKTLERIRSLVIPPAWTDVWIAPRANAHIQATGRDAKARKQYKYHPLWREVRDHAKFDRMIAFAEALPRIRERIDHDLRRPGLPREKVMAAVLKLLESTLIRVGNDEYATKNDSFGLTTLRDHHVQVGSQALRFEFRGKSGKWHNVALNDRRLARVVKQCQEVPGDRLFQYVDESGKQRAVTSGDVNAYLRDIAGQEFTAKDYRTWGATVLTLMALEEMGPAELDTVAKKNLAEATKAIARHLGNTPTVCRNCYMHPGLIEDYIAGTLLPVRAPGRVARALEGLADQELKVLSILKRREKALMAG